MIGHLLPWTGVLLDQVMLHPGMCVVVCVVAAVAFGCGSMLWDR